MEYKRLSSETVEAYIAYLHRATAEEPDMMWAEAVDETGIRARIADPFYASTTSILAMEGGLVLGRIEYHFYGCIQDGYRMAYVDWVYVLRQYRHRGIAQGLFRAFEGECRKHRIDEYFLIRAENDNAQRFYHGFAGAELSSSPCLRKQLDP